MALQTALAEFLDGVVRAYGPFVIPVALFVVGAVGYAALVAVGRAGVDRDAGTASTGASASVDSDPEAASNAGRSLTTRGESNAGGESTTRDESDAQGASNDREETP